MIMKETFICNIRVVRKIFRKFKSKSLVLILVFNVRTFKCTLVAESCKLIFTIESAKTTLKNECTVSYLGLKILRKSKLAERVSWLK